MLARIEKIGGLTLGPHKAGIIDMEKYFANPWEGKDSSLREMFFTHRRRDQSKGDYIFRKGLQNCVLIHEL